MHEKQRKLIDLQVPMVSEVIKTMITKYENRLAIKAAMKRERFEMTYYLEGLSISDPIE